MEKISFIRKINCEICKNKLLKVYIRGSNKFKSLENYFYCENCQKIFQAKENEKNNN